MKHCNRVLCWVTLSALLVLPLESLQGADMTGKIGLSLHPGIYKLGLTDRSDIWTLGALGNVGVKAGITPRFTLGIEGSWMQTYLADLSEGTKADDGAGFTTDGVDGGPRQRAFIIGLVAEYHLLPEQKWSPYFFAGPGIYIWKWADPDWNTLYSNSPYLSTTRIPPVDQSGNPYELKDKELYGMAGLGVEFFPSEALSVELGGKFRYLTHVLTDFKDQKDIVGTDPGQLDLPKADMEVYAGLTFYLGGKAKDQDLDGVKDKKDRCPATPIGCLVDPNGCPLDSDGDGVCDGMDQCRNTPKGARVDGRGCPTDADGDGIFDGIDKCPNTPEGCTTDETGCQKDSDGDTVCDGVDKCPNTPKGCRVDVSGCPLDSDADGVCDGMDRCPNTPPNTEVNEIGCEIPKVEYIPPPEKPLILKGVNFTSNLAVLLESSKAILDGVAVSLKAHPDVKVEIGGHCDASGSEAHNLKLSEDRAKAVRDYLVSKGVNPDNLQVRGYGEALPIASNDTKAGRAENRRVELKRIP